MSLNRHKVRGTSCSWSSWFGNWTYWVSGEGTKPCPHPHDTLEDEIEKVLRETVWATAAGPVAGIEQAVDRIVAMMRGAKMSTLGGAESGR